MREQICLVPGDYEIAAALYDTESTEHSLRRTKIRVPERRSDPLPELWTGLPKIAAGRVCSAPPRIATEKAVRIDLIVNKPVVPGDTIASRLRLLSEIAVPNGSMHVTLLDLERQQELFETQVTRRGQSRSWMPHLRVERNKISVHALENAPDRPQFFVGEIRRALERKADERSRVVIVMSEPRQFPKGADLRPIEASLPPATTLIYLRCNARVWAFNVASQGPPPGPEDWSAPPELPRGPVAGPRGVDNSDSLERTLEPLGPRLFDIATPEQFRNALAAILREIS